MESDFFDFVVIGGGSAGYAAARTAREQAERVAIIDDAPELGGLCILRGCMPSKTLLYSAEVLHLARQARGFGLDIPAATVDMPGLHRRKRRHIDEFKRYRQEQLHSDRFTLLRERARFVADDTVELQPSGRRLRAKAFCIATGSEVNRPPLPGLELEGIWTSDEVLDLDFLPSSLIMLGGGIVACELTQFLQRVGTRVIQIQRSPRILRETSPEAAAVIEGVFRDEGVELHTDTQLERIDRSGEGFRVHFRHHGQPRVAEACHLCNALGRRPRVGDLGLDVAGVERRLNGQIMVNEFQRTTNPRIYAAGDVTGPFEIVHLAIMQGEVAARHARGEKPEPVNYRTRTGVIFTDPQIASVGLTPGDPRKPGHDVIIASYPFNDHGKSLLMEAPHGYVKAWADRRDGRLLGAECVGKDAGELIHAMAVAVSLGARVPDLLKVHWYHPTLSEIWSYPLEELAEAMA
jgi:pyruvate/2-oxoglutarate dehydrogenase complex dihydrolipoamide dehydrogenase (E3) component